MMNVYLLTGPSFNSEAPVLAGVWPEYGKSFTEEVLFLIHQTRIHDKTSYSCDECGADVIGKVSLSNHKKRHKIPAVKNLRKQKCEKCPYKSECMERKGENNIFAKHAISLCKHKQD